LQVLPLLLFLILSTATNVETVFARRTAPSSE
jgi:hypothetical protein